MSYKSKVSICVDVKPSRTYTLWKVLNETVVGIAPVRDLIYKQCFYARYLDAHHRQSCISIIRSKL